jgi:WD40 repeat protein
MKILSESRGPSNVAPLALSPDGSTLLVLVPGPAAYHEGNEILTLFDVGTQSPWNVTLPKNIYEGFVGNCTSFSHDGQLMAILYPDGKLRVWQLDHETKSVTELWTAQTDNVRGVMAVAFAPDGSALLTIGTSAQLWQSQTGKPIGVPLKHDVGRGRDARLIHSFAFSDDGDLATFQAPTIGADGLTDSGSVFLWNIATAERAGDPLRLQVGDGSMHLIGFDYWGRFVMKGNSIVTISVGDKRAAVNVWDTITGRLIGPRWPLRHEGEILAHSLACNGMSAVTGGADSTARLWNLQTGELVVPPMKHDGPVITVAFAPDEEVVISGSMDGTGKLWNRSTGELIGSPLKHSCPVEYAAFTSDARTVVTAGRNWKDRQVVEIRTWDASSSKPLSDPHILRHSTNVTTAAFAQNGRIFATACSGGTIRLWDAETGESVSAGVQDSPAVIAIAFIADDSLLLAGCADSFVYLWDAETGQQVGPRLEHPGSVATLAVSSVGDRFLVGDHCSGSSNSGITVRNSRAYLRSVPSSKFGGWLWAFPSVTEIEPRRLSLWIQVATGMELDDSGRTLMLSPEMWTQRHEQLQELGGAPKIWEAHAP